MAAELWADQVFGLAGDADTFDCAAGCILCVVGWVEGTDRPGLRVGRPVPGCVRPGMRSTDLTRHGLTVT